jgi:uncharacterized Ntn-hydrolase superfamily protein
LTYSIVARDSETGDLGVAVQSQAFNTGAAVPWARAGVGAIATQSFTDRRYGWRGLELMADGMSPEDVLAHLLAEDELADFRQVGMLSADRRAAQSTGAHCVPDAGSARGETWLTQANMVASPRVWEAMGQAFEESAGCLAERLMSALEAAEQEGGDWRGRGGAAIVVVPKEGDPWERIIDLRVEEGDDSLAELRRLLTRALGYREANRAVAGREDIGRRNALPEDHVRRLALHDAVERGNLAQAKTILAELEQEEPRWRDFYRTLSLLPEMSRFASFLDETG